MLGHGTKILQLTHMLSINTVQNSEYIHNENEHIR